MKAPSDPTPWPRRILVPCDFSDCSIAALKHATTLAQMAGGTLVLLHVTEPVTPGFLIEVKALRQTQKQLRARVIAELTTLANTLTFGMHVRRPLVKAGKPWEVIVSAASLVPADLIVLGTHGHTGLKHAVLGSVAERVVRHAPCPVLTVRK